MADQKLSALAEVTTLDPTDKVYLIDPDSKAVTFANFALSISSASKAELDILDGATLTTAELNTLAGVTAGAVSPSKAVVVDANEAIDQITIVDLLIGPSGSGVSYTTEIGYLSGLTGNVQSQLDLKAPLESPALTGTPTAPTPATSDNSTKIATTAMVQQVAFSTVLPDQTGNADKFLQTDGSIASWQPALEPSNNLSDVDSAATSRTNLDVYSKAETDARAGVIHIATATVATGTTVDIDGVFSASYDTYKLEFDLSSESVGANSVDLQFIVGGTPLSGAFYDTSYHVYGAGAAPVTGFAATQTSGGMGTYSGLADVGRMRGEIVVHQPLQSGTEALCEFSTVSTNDGTGSVGLKRTTGVVAYNNTTPETSALSGIRLLSSSMTGTVRLYGYSKVND